MTETTQAQLAALQDLRLPDLQAQFAEIVGEETRCPNKAFLLRRIAEVLEADLPESGSPGDLPLCASNAEEPTTAQESAEPPSNLHDDSEALGAADEPATDTADEEPMDAQRANADELADEASEAEAADAAAAAEADAVAGADGAGDAAADADADDTDSTDPGMTELLAADSSDGAGEARLRDLDVDGLRARYLEVVGRKTNSHDRRYLIWKIRQAGQGRVPVGPVGRREPGGAAVEHKVLPLRMPTETVAALDDVWRRHGLHSRMDLFRQALDQYLTGLGEQAAAASVRGE